MKPTLKGKARPFCQILRAPPLTIEKNRVSGLSTFFNSPRDSAPIGQFPSSTKTGTSIRFSLQAPSMEGSFNDSSTHNLPEFSGEIFDIAAESLTTSLSNYSCIESNCWNVIRNSKKFNGNCRRQSEVLTPGLQKPKFSSSKVVKALAHTVKMCNPKPTANKPALNEKTLSKPTTCNNTVTSDRLKKRAGPDLLLDRSVNSSKGKKNTTTNLWQKIRNNAKNDKGKENANKSNIKIMCEFTVPC